jgi:choline dehydrogenase-like flavoprotein
MVEAEREAFDYIVVGSGAGGGTVAARLAEAGMKVLVLEAGADPAKLEADGLPQDYDVPAFHPFASENKAMAWNYRVHDFGDDAGRRTGQDADGRRGVLYPRASTLGGCTAHNAMILMIPQDSDWNDIAASTGDPSWRAENMRHYFQLLENCRHRPLWRRLARLSGGLINPTGHGWDGWLPSEWPLPTQAFGDDDLVRMVRDAVKSDLFGESKSWAGSAKKRLRRFVERVTRLVVGEDDPNDRRLQGPLAEGATMVPLSTLRGRRRGTRERVIEAARRHGLGVEFDALATKILFDDRNRAVGVEYRHGRNLYRACSNPSPEDGEPCRVFASREVILAAGAFNTPQLLMLSGVGARHELAKHGIASRVAHEGVGRNLQDRYEIGVVHKTVCPWACLKGVDFTISDPAYREWLRGRGMYLSNGAAIAFSLRSTVMRESTDLFAMALLTRFSGYFTGYSNVIRESRDDLTFAVLKAHTANCGGRVTLYSNDPRDPPRIDFRGFEEGTDKLGEDLAAVVEGIRRVRMMAASMQPDLLAPEDTPGVVLTDDEQLKQYVREHAWGHHASCTCRIGPPEKGGVLTSDFRVHGTEGLRVVDASVFPRIPGFFIVCAVYMIAEKAADVILDAASARA